MEIEISNCKRKNKLTKRKCIKCGKIEFPKTIRFSSPLCRDCQIANNSTKVRKEKRKKLRKEHRCIWCKEKVKPVITYPQFCPKHKPKRNGK